MRKFKSIILLSILISMAALFTACSSEPHVSTAEIIEIFYTLDDPNKTEYKNMHRETKLKFGNKYNLLFAYLNPDLNVEKATFYIDGKKTDYILNNLEQSEIMGAFFRECGFTRPDNYNNEPYTLNLTVELIDKKGRKSLPYSWEVVVQGQFTEA
ncbi:MAG: hypothetical protein KIG83_04135 [Treponema sp.]|nr:hypothetical protein [Treponema sp.]